MLQSLWKLLSPDGFMPHGHCYLWEPALVSLHVISDSLIFLAYFSIPLTLLHFFRKKRDVPFNWVFLAFGVFILACGTTHLMEIWTIWNASYWLAGFVKAITAAASVSTAIALVRAVPQALALRSPEELERINRLLEKEISERKLVEQEVRILNSQLEQRVIERTSALTKANEALRQEIATRIQVDQALAVDRNLLRTLIDNLPDYIYTKDTARRYVLSNRANLKRLQTATEADLTGKTVFDVFPEEVARQLDEDDRQVLSSGKAIHDREEEFVDSSGRTRCLLTTKLPLIDRTGSTMGLIGVSHDVTERKRLEEQLLQSHKMEAIGRLAGGIAHDFNNILTAIIGYAEFSKLSLSTDDPLRSSIDQIRRAGDRAAELTRQLLAFARKQIIEPKVVNVNDLILKMHNMLARLIGENIELVSVLQPDLGLTKIDPGQFEQVLINVAVNARDAIFERGTIAIETQNVCLDEEYCRQNLEITPRSYIQIAVSDTGVGMDAHTRSQVFEPFFTTKGKGKGTGLGLATCYGIVKQAGGHIWLYSEPGKGTTVKIYLPETPDAPVEVTTQEIGTNSLEGTETILLVEDEPSVRELAQKVLARQGYRVLTAPTADESVQLAEDYVGTIDLIVTDVVMPRMGGKQLAERISRTRSGIKVLFISGYTENAIVHQGVLEADTQFLSKPFTPAGLARKVREVLESP